MIEKKSDVLAEVVRIEGMVRVSKVPSHCNTISLLYICDVIRSQG